MKDQKDQVKQPETQSYLDKLETATPTQASQSLAAQVMQDLKKLLEDK